MIKSIIALAALASTSSFVTAQQQIIPPYPFTQILPVPGWNSTTDGFNSLGDLYANSAAQLSAQVVAIAQKNVQISGSGGVQYSLDVKPNLTSSLTVVIHLLWQTAYQAEQKVCAITTSINQQNVDNVKGKLHEGILAEVDALASIALTLTNTVAAVKSRATSFTESEKAVVSTLIQAIAAAANASLGPVANLSAGLAAVGATGLTEVFQSLQVAVTALQNTAAINWAF